MKENVKLIKNPINQLVFIKIQLIELFVSVLNNMDLHQIHVKKHVLNINILHYRMEMVIKDGVVVIVI